jgi:hypothetical protein
MRPLRRYASRHVDVAIGFGMRAPKFFRRLLVEIEPPRSTVGRDHLIPVPAAVLRQLGDLGGDPPLSFCIQIELAKIG